MPTTIEKEITVASGLGDAEPSQVLKGINFSSESGFNQVGELVPSSVNGDIVQEKVTEGYSINEGDFCQKNFLVVNQSLINSTYSNRNVIKMPNSNYLVRMRSGYLDLLYYYNKKITTCAAGGYSFNVGVAEGMTIFAVDDSRILLAHGYDNNESVYLKLIKVDTDNFTFTALANTTVTTGNGRPRCIDMVELSSNVICVLQADYDYIYLYTVTVDSSNTITVAKKTTISSSGYKTGSLAKINDTTVLVKYGCHASATGQTMLCRLGSSNFSTITSITNSITPNNSYMLQIDEEYVLSVEMEKESEVLVSKIRVSSSTIEVVDTTIIATAGTLTPTYGSSYVYIEKLNTNLYVVHHGLSISFIEISPVFKVLNTIVTDDIYCCGKSLIIKNNEVLAWGGRTTYLRVYESENFVHKASISDTIYGVAKTSGNGGDTIDVYIPN